MTREIKLDSSDDQVISSAVKKELETLVSEVRNSLHLEWMRSAQVRKMLGIGDSTLQNLRINGMIPAYKLGGIWFYRLSEINDAIEQGRIHNDRRA